MLGTRHPGSRVPRAPNLGRLYRFERRYWTFSRTVGLPQGVAESDVHADCKNGVLKVDVRRPEQPKPKRIQLSSGAGGGQTGEEVTPSPEEAPDDGPTWDRPLNRADVSASVGVASDPTVATFWSGVRREEGPFAPRVSGCGCLPQQGGEASSTPIDFCPDHPGSESPSGGSAPPRT